jgi:hypothetical protein
MRGNIYGIQKVEESDVRSNRDIALTTSGMAAQGAKMGSALGPYGAAAGALVGAGAGLYANKKAKKEEENRVASQQGYNRFVETMSGRAARSQQSVGPQARNGMKSKGRYQMAEIEGAGPGKVGEIHTDKNFNIKNVANGAPKHENGGVTVGVKDGDVIFPTQGKDGDYRNVMRDIKRYKMGDERAGKRLRARRDKLPKDSDYNFEGGGVVGKPYSKAEFAKLQSDGIMVDMDYNSYKEQYLADQDADETDFEGIDDSAPFIPYADQSRNKVDENNFPENYSKSSPLNPNNKLEAQAKESNLDPNKVKEFIDENKNLIKEVNNKGNYKKLETRLKAYDIDPKQFQDHLDKTVGEGSNITGSAGIGPKFSKATSKLVDMYKEGDNTLANSTPAPFDAFSSPDTVPKKPPLDEEEPTGFKGTGLDPSEILLRENADLAGEFGSDTPMRINAIDTEEEKEKEKEKTKLNLLQRGKDAIENIDFGNENPLKRTNILANLAKGLEPSEQVTRRNFIPEESEYRDLSESARQANIENRNFQTRRLQGQTNRGAALGTNAQVNAQYMRQAQEINEREAGRQYQTDMGNVALRNQAKQANLQMANQYDQQDAQNRAASQKFLSQAAAETTNLSQYDEQRKYMMDRDNRQFAQDRESMQYVGSKYFGYDENGNRRYSGPGSAKKARRERYDFNTELGLNPDGSVKKETKKSNR